MTIETIVPWILTIFFGFCTLYFSGKAYKREENKQVKQDSTDLATVMAKLDFISDDIKEIKNDNKAMRSEMNEFRERLAENEASIKSLHKRLDTFEHQHAILN